MRLLILDIEQFTFCLFQWEAFSIPELENFLKILDREEEEYIDQVRHRYQLLKIQMDQQLASLEEERRQLGIHDQTENGKDSVAKSSDSVPDGFEKDTREPVFV